MNNPYLSLRIATKTGKNWSGGYHQYLKLLISVLSDVTLVKFLLKGGAGLSLA
jgi:hypothetical protein